MPLPQQSKAQRRSSRLLRSLECELQTRSSPRIQSSRCLAARCTRDCATHPQFSRSLALHLTLSALEAPALIFAAMSTRQSKLPVSRCSTRCMFWRASLFPSTYATTYCARITRSSGLMRRRQFDFETASEPSVASSGPTCLLLNSLPPSPCAQHAALSSSLARPHSFACELLTRCAKS